MDYFRRYIGCALTMIFRDILKMVLQLPIAVDIPENLKGKSELNFKLSTT